ncbi:ribosomal RNA processing protein 1 homolog A-like [Arachis ipaensis]|uniref:ribosomal RNA processing protein 1 homolog A-like n=1 Tax=Arachis ipaensis TaxID=130454 RepID=UPI000A2B5F74|nr:ribosomal RNA processing protein 1 homolog A-like [Arachis ipaensis]
MSYFSVKIHHGRKFRFDGEPLHYVGDETSIVDYCDEDRWSRFEAMEIVLEQGYVVENIATMWYKSLNDETDVELRMLHTDKDAMDMARIGMRDNMVELFVVHKDATTTRKGCTIEKVEEIDGDEAAAPTADTIGPGPIVLHKAQFLAQAKVGKKPKVVTKAQNDVLEDGDEERSEGSDFLGDEESEDDDYQLGIDDEGDSDEQWSENSSGDTDLQVAFDDSDDDWNGDGGLYDVEVTTTKDSQRPKQSVPTEREQ